MRGSCWLSAASSILKKSLSQLITRADGIQHAVPSFDELDGAWRA
jgi:hypothetical protein